jgi:uncharacterized membrane protein
MRKKCLGLSEREGDEMIHDTYIKAICMGVIAGMRSMSAPAFVSNYLVHQNSKELADSSFGLMGSARVAKVLKIAAVGEMIADKLPAIPARISPVPLVARILSGGLCGASICTAEGKRADVGAIFGGLSAIGSAYTFYHLRRKLGEIEGLPGAALGLGEDAIVVGSGLSILSDDASA